METNRSILIIGLMLVSFLLWIEYQEQNAPLPVKTAEQVQAEQAAGSVPTATTATNETSFVPEANQNTVIQPIASQPLSNERLIKVSTDTLSLLIDTQGGDVVSAELIKYPITQNGTDSYPIMTNTPSLLYIAQSGLIGEQGPDQRNARAKYSATASEYTLEGDTLEVPLTTVTEAGLQVTKTFVFTADSHVIEVKYNIVNNTGANAQVQQYAQLKQVVTERSSGSMFMPTYRGTAYSTQDERYEKYPFNDIEDDPLRLTTIGGWVGMLEHYFVSAWVPPQLETNSIYSTYVNNNAIIGYTGQPLVIAPNETAEVSSTLYVGPKDQEVLAGLARGLDLTVDYGFLWWIAQPLFSLLKMLHELVGNWGVAIILITLIVKGLMYWLTKKQYESMAKMRALSPKLQQLKDRFGDDRQKMSQAMMELYKKEKVNPMGGCFPLLLQMPIFLALYWVLLESVELRHADFALWITDLSVRDPFFVLPILTGVSMYLLQKLQPMTIQDPLQQKIFQYMPVAMSIFFIFFPAGLVLYWLISNLVTLVQAKMIYASMEKRGMKTS